MNISFVNESRGFLSAVLTALILGAVICAIVFFSDLKETFLDSCANFVLIVSVFIGGCQASRRGGNRGLLRGVTVGLLFFVFMLIMTLWIDSSQFTISLIGKSVFFDVVAGALGGIVGVSLQE